MANDIIDIDVFQTVENVEITVEPNLTTVNITQINAGNGSVPVGGTVGQVLAKIDSANFNTEWVNQSGGGGGGIPDAPNNANAYVRSGLAWVIGYTKTAIDNLISSSLVGYATQSWVNSQGFITNVISALGFTPYNATNPSGYQTVANIEDTLYLFSESLVPVFADKQPLSAVLTATTASFTTTDETKLDGIATGATANSSDATLLARANHTGTQLANTISDFDSSTRAQTEAELVAGTNITITPSGTGATRQLTISSSGGGGATSGSGTVPSGNITWTGTAPTSVLYHTYEWEEDNNVVNLRINLSYTVSGNSQSVTIALPNDAPTPKDILGFTNALEIVTFGSGMMFNVVSSLPGSAGRYCLLRRNTSNTGYEIVVTHGTAQSVRTVALTIQYFK